MRLNQLEAYTYYKDYCRCKSKKERGKFISDLSGSLKIHPSTIHRAFSRIKNNASVSHRNDKTIPRYKDMTQEEAKLTAQKVAAAKNEMATKNGKTMETGRVVLALYNAGQIRYRVPTSTMNRWLNWFGYSYRQIENYSKSTGARLRTDRPNKWIFVDSSVSELYYLGKKERIVRDNSGILTDKNHREERLTKKGYRKLLIFGAVDLYSDAYWFNAYVVPGESAVAWTMFLMDLFQKKDDPNNPFRGIPENIYSDRGSGLHSSRARHLFEPLGIKFWDHMPGNAKAKGKIEARIGAYKNTIERCLAFEKIDSIERYREITQKMIVADNIKKGYYSRWMEIYKTPEYLKEFDPSLRSKVGYTMIERKVNPYGCVSIEGIEYFISQRLNGEWVSIFNLLDDTLKATDRSGNIYDLRDIAHQHREMGVFKAEKKTEYDHELDAIKEEGKSIKEVLKPEHFLDAQPENMVIFHRPGSDVEVSSPFDREKITTQEDAWYRVYKDTGFAQKDLPHEVRDKVDWLFIAMIRKDGEIIPEKFSEILEIITDTMREAKAL